MLCYFQVYGRVIQLYMYMYLSFFRFFSHIADFFFFFFNYAGSSLLLSGFL